MSGLDSRRRLLAALFCLALTALPFLAVRIPPVTDLPQQMAQIPLALETLAGQAPDYRIQWLSPNKLSYLPLGLSWAVLPPFGAVAMAMILMAAIWIFSWSRLAARRNRPVEGAILATLLFFNQSVYMGFLNFTIGVAAFVFWIQESGASGEETREPRSVFARTLVGALLLYYSHVLWLAMGLTWLGLSWLWNRPGRRVLGAALAGVAPVIALAITWYPSLARQNWVEGATVYGNSPWERLLPFNLATVVFGGVRGALEPLTLLAIVTWALAAFWQNRSRLADKVDLRLLLTAMLFISSALLLPLKLQMTVLFSDRWMPIGVALFLLALPRPQLGALAGRATALGLVAIFALTTAGIWIDFERYELAGLYGSLERLPDEPRLLGLDYVRESPRMKIPPYFQLPAYSQLLHGGRLGFSFVTHASSLVVRRDMRSADPWTPALEWYPHLLRGSDLDHFDFVLVHGSSDVQEALQTSGSRLAPVSEPATWRLFEVDRIPGATNREPVAPE